MMLQAWAKWIKIRGTSSSAFGWQGNLNQSLMRENRRDEHTPMSEFVGPGFDHRDARRQILSYPFS